MAFAILSFFLTSSGYLKLQKEKDLDYKLAPESQFLRDIAVREFNFQYHRDIDPILCTIKSIVGGYGCTHGYEIESMREGDHLRLRMYFNLGDLDQFLPYRLETDKSFATASLGDEVYVTIGTINQYYVDSGTYRFRTLNTTTSDDKAIHFMNGEVLQYTDGGIAEYAA